jgi:N-acetyl sugar amidotransferase
MDSTDSAIVFDENGVCDHCNRFYKLFQKTWDSALNGSRIHEIKKIAKIIQKQKGNSLNNHNCLIGISGGLDSSYMLHYLVTELGLRPLVFHIDTGWNTQASVSNIHNLVTKLDLDLHVEVIDWEEMRALQLAFLKSGVSNIDVPQDHALMAAIYHFADKNNVKFIFNGGNISTEGIKNPLEWMYYQSDVSQLRDIAKQYMEIPLKTYPISSVLNHKLNLRYRKGIQVIKVLDYIPYIKSEAIDVLKKSYDWQPVKNKHYESIFTRFYEGYWLPQRFNYDTRKVTFSSMILTGQMSREEALEILKEPALSKLESDKECSYVAKKLRISTEDLQHLKSIPIKTFRDFNNQNFLYNLGVRASALLKSDISGVKR